ncbi:MAG: hypothetical protein ABW032_07365, partial [Burkholderiaceae bacterium]
MALPSFQMAASHLRFALNNVPVDFSSSSENRIVASTDEAKPRLDCAADEHVQPGSTFGGAERLAMMGLKTLKEAGFGMAWASVASQPVFRHRTGLKTMLLTLLGAGSLPLVAAGAKGPATGLSFTRMDVDPIKLSLEITDGTGALNATAVGIKRQEVSIRSMFDATNIASTCRQLGKESEIGNQVAWLQQCLSTSGLDEEEFRKPTEPEMGMVNDAVYEFALDYEKFKTVIQDQSISGGVLLPPAVAFRKRDDKESAECHIWKSGSVPLSRMVVLNERTKPEEIKHKLVHGHTHESVNIFFRENPKLKKIFFEAITLYINRKTLSKYSNQGILKRELNSHRIIEDLLLHSEIVPTLDDAAQAGFRFLQDVFYTVDGQVGSKLIAGMLADADRAEIGAKSKIWGVSAEQKIFALSATLGCLLFAIHKWKNSAVGKAEIPERSLISSTPVEPLDEGWVDIEVEMDCHKELQQAVDDLELSVSSPIPKDISSYLFHTYASKTLAIVIDVVAGSPSSYQMSNESMKSKATREIYDAANRYMMKLPRSLTAADWKVLYQDTIGSNPFFQRREEKLHPKAREGLQRLRTAMVRVMSGEMITTKQPAPGARTGDSAFKLAHMKELFERYDLLLNMPTERQIVDFNEVLVEPKEKYLKLVAKRLNLIGKTRF